MNSLNDFRRVLADWRQLGPYLVAGSTAVPLVDLVVKLGPVWPVGAPVLFSLVAALGNVGAFHITHRWRPGAVDRSIRVAIGVSFASLACYLAAWGILTVRVPAHDQRIPIGWSVQPDAQRAIDELGRKGVPLSDAIGLLNYRIEGGEAPLDAPLGIWRNSTVHASRFALAALWGGLVLGLSWTSIAFTLYHRRTHARLSATDRLRAVSKKTKAGAAAAIVMFGTVGRPSAEQLQKIDLSSEYDRRSRQELDAIDSSFMRWQFPSPLQWTVGGEDRASALDGIIINKGNVQAYNRFLRPENWWMPITFTLAHEKSHLVQTKKYGNEIDNYPRIVREAQADVMAGAYVFLRIMKLKVDVAPDNRVVISSEATERDPAAFAEARKQEVFDLMRLGFKLGRTSPGGEHPEGWERGQAVLQGLFAGVGMLRLSLGQTDQSGFRQEFGFTIGEDFADWSLRKAYEIVGLPDGERHVSMSRFTLSNTQDPIGSVLRECVETAPQAFRPLRGAQVRQDNDSIFFGPTIRLPDFGLAIIEVDREDPLSATVRYSKKREFPDDIELGTYRGLQARLGRLLREGWTTSPERVSEKTLSQRWMSADSAVEVSIVHYPKAVGGEISLRVSVEHISH